jgi:molybdopterin synthase sulfur carrier subunit
MNLNIKYFGVLAEITQCSEETLPFSEGTVGELLTMLKAKYPALGTKDFQVAHKQEIVTKDTKITNPEIALLPPFSGG